MPSEDIAQACRFLSGLPESVWSEYMRTRDPLSGRIDTVSYRALFDRCGESGRTEAQRARVERRFGDLDELAAHLGVTVRAAASGVQGPVRVFALYTEPDRIEVDEKNAHLAQSLAERAGLGELMGTATVRDVLLAHELFHVVCRNIEDLPCQERVVPLVSLGPLRRLSRLPTLEEVTAMAFARELCGLGCQPYVLDYVMLLPSRPQAARAYYARIGDIAQGVGVW